jgi:AcrR family transcriptional regulator
VTVQHADEVRAIVPDGIDPPASIDPEIFAAATSIYRAGQRLEMQALARQIGVGRATLYRRAGNREQVLDEVLWWQGRHALVAAVEQTNGLRGTERIVAVIERILHTIRADAALRTLLETDPEGAMRLLTGARSTVQQGMIGALARLIDLETERGDFRATLDSPTLAYAIVRIAEGFLYADIIADRAPDIDQAHTVIAGLLRGVRAAAES